MTFHVATRTPRHPLRLRAAALTALLSALLCAAAWGGSREDAERAAEQLTQQARELWKDGRYAQVLPLVKRALAISEKNLGPEHPLTVRSLNNVANCRLKTGSYGEAELLYRRVLAIREKTLGPEHPDVAAALNNLAIVHGALGDYARAEALQRRALAIREKALGTNHVDTATSLTNLAILYLDTGDYARAEPLYQRALNIREQVQGAEHLDTAGAIFNLATVYFYTGAYAQAEALNRRALAIYEKVRPPQHPDIADTLNNLGEVYVAMHAYSRALPMYERALAIREATLGAEHPRVAGSLNNLAGLYRVTGEVAKAGDLYQRALAITQRRLGPQHPDTAKALNNLANLYLDTGAYTKAEPLYARALAIREKTLGARHPEVVQALNNLALNSWARGQMPRALSLLQRAQAIQAQNSEQFLFSGSESRQHAYLQALVEDTFVRVSFSLATHDRTALENDTLGRAGTEVGLASVLQYKGRVLDTVTDNVARLRRSMNAADRRLLDRLAYLANQASTVLYRGGDAHSLAGPSQRLTELTRQQEALEVQLAQRSSEFRQQTRPVTITGIKQALPQDAVLVEWIRYTPYSPTAASVQTQWGSPRYAAYVLSSRDAPTVIDMGDAKVLDRLAADFNLAASDPKRDDVRQRAAALSDQLIKPLLPLLRAHPHWLLAPDGPLNLVPMAALLDEQGRYLAERFEISYLSSGRDLLRIASAAPSTNLQAVLVADPDYGASPVTTFAATLQQTRESADVPGLELVFKPLPGTALEAQSLQELLAPRTAAVLTRRDASEEQLRRLQGPRLLHIATHGFFLDAVPSATPTSGAGPSASSNPLLRAGLALAGANVRRSGASDDGILTAMEVAQLNLRGTQLVVLSACETALGEAASGEGVYGMRRALALAGAETQVTSLWQVSDQATRRLMVDFYRRLLQGAGRSAALHAAQRDMMADPARWHPYYWAGFVPVGNWQPMRQ